MPRINRSRRSLTKKTKTSKARARPRAARSAKPRTSALNASSIFDLLEKLSGILPHIVKGGRGIFNSPKTAGASAGGLGSIEKEVSFQTPASFAVIRNNTTSMTPEQRVDHPEKGVSGIRRTFTQPFNGVNLQQTPEYYFDGGGVPPAQWIDINSLPINPLLLGGPIAAFAQLYDRYVIRKARWRYTTTQTTTFLGTTCWCIEKDFGNLIATNFNTARQVVPNVVFPYRVPSAELFYEYDGPELYYVNSLSLGTPATLLPAEGRQDIQFVFKGFDSNYSVGFADPTQVGYVDLEMEIDFYDPIPPSTLVGLTEEERLAHLTLRNHYRTRENLAKSPNDILRIRESEKQFSGALSRFLDEMPRLPTICGALDNRPGSTRRKQVSAAAADEDEDDCINIPMLPLKRAGTGKAVVNRL